MDMVADMDKGGWAEWAEEGAGVEPTDKTRWGPGDTTRALALGAAT